MSRRPNLRVVRSGDHYDGAAQEKADRAREKAEKKAAEDKAEASFKLDLIMCSNADHRLKPADKNLLVAYVGRLKWPKRTSWLSFSHARGRSCLSERQVTISRNNLEKHGYLKLLHTEGATQVFAVVNLHELELKDQIQDRTKAFRVAANERRTIRRRDYNEIRAAALADVTAKFAVTDDQNSEAVPANFAGTDEPMSPQNLPDVPAENAGNFPLSSLEEECSRGRKGRRGASAAISSKCFSGLSDLLKGRDAPQAVVAFWLKAEGDGTLDAAMVERYFDSLPETEAEPPPAAAPEATSQIAKLERTVGKDGKNRKKPKPLPPPLDAQQGDLFGSDNGRMQ